MLESLEFPDFIPVGNEGISSLIINLWQKNRLPQGILFSGISGIGKYSIAMQTASILISKETIDEKVTKENVYRIIHENISASEVTKIVAFSNPNFLLVSPEQEKEKKVSKIISVEQVRGIENFLRLKSDTKCKRVVVIDSIDDFNNNASNALLKILEEPPLNTHFFLISHSSANVLPTIRSRVQTFNFKPLINSEIREILSKKMQNIDEKALKLCAGSISRAIWLSSEEGMFIYHYLNEALGNLSSYETLQDLVNKIRSKNERDVFYLLLAMLKEKIIDLSINYGKNESLLDLFDSINNLEKDVNTIYLDAGYGMLSILNKLNHIMKH